MPQDLNRRSADMAKAMTLSRAARLYAEALAAGAGVGDCYEWIELLRAQSDMTGCDHCHDAHRDASPPDTDIFGNAIGSRAATIAEAGWNEGKQI